MADVNCNICMQPMSDNEEKTTTACSHTFHKACLQLWENQKKDKCPICQTALTKKSTGTIKKGNFHMTLKPKPGSQTADTLQQQQREALRLEQQREALRLEQQQQQQQQEALILEQRQREVLQQQQQLGTENLLEENNNVSQRSDEETRIRNLVTAIVSARNSSMIQALEETISERIGRKVDDALAEMMRLVRLNNQEITTPIGATANNHTHAGRENHLWKDPPMLSNPLINDSPLNNSGFNRNMDNIRFSNEFTGRNSSRIAQLISSWDIKFNGSPKLPVESFIYRIESQVIDTLGGDFNLLCEHLQSILLGDARDWYWNYRRTVNRITWPSFCEALKLNFEEHKTDTEIKEQIRNRKQGPTELFDEYRNAIYKLSERLSNRIPESEMVEIIQRGLRPRVRQQLLYVPIQSVTELRKLCLKGESLYNEIAKHTPINNNNSRPFQKRIVNEVNIDQEDFVNDLGENISELKKINKELVCWNCRGKGHRYFDCLEPRRIFCYGCGAENEYKPTCNHCNPGNSKLSETFKLKTRQDQN